MRLVLIKNIPMKSIFSMLMLVSSYTSFLYSQVNQVVNPSFEDISSCPNNIAQLYLASGWDTLVNGGGGSIDLYHECAASLRCGVPTNWQVTQSCKGFQVPKSGVAYAGVVAATVFASGVEYREYTQSRLINSLENGKEYCIKMHVSLGNCSEYSCTSIGVLLDAGQIQSIGNQIPNPQVYPQLLSQNLLDDTLNWILLEESFTANGTETFLTIGNFFNDSLSGIFHSFPSSALGIYSGAYYYIDDVSVIDISTLADAGEDVTITAGDSIYLGRPSEIGLDEACIWFLDGVPIDTVAGIMVAPDSTTTYILQQSICGNVQYDTVTVTIDTGTGLNYHEKAYKFEIYPNPNDGNMMLAYQLETNEKGKITVCDITGRQVISYNLANDQNNLSISQAVLENGVYFFSIMVDGNVVATKKVVIIK
jgi:hypothetical protein